MKLFDVLYECIYFILINNIAITFQSIILPMYNAEKWLDECLQSVYDQQFDGHLELSVYNDSSNVSVTFDLLYCCVRAFNFVYY